MMTTSVGWYPKWREMIRNMKYDGILKWYKMCYVDNIFLTLNNSWMTLGKFFYRWPRINRKNSDKYAFFYNKDLLHFLKNSWHTFYPSSSFGILFLSSTYFVNLSLIFSTLSTPHFITCVTSPPYLLQSTSLLFNNDY